VKKFHFKFETVQKVRKQAEEAALRTLGEAQRAHQAALARKQSLMDDLVAALKRREALGAEPVSPVAFQLESEFISGTKVRIGHAELGIQKAMRGVEKALRAFLHARKQLRMIETIREKHFAEFKQQLRKREEKEQNDLYLMRARMAGLRAWEESA
jgi:flagellar export protein FliJ